MATCCLVTWVLLLLAVAPYCVCEGDEDLGDLSGLLSLFGGAMGGAGGSGCTHSCPNGHSPVERAGHTPRHNGCGTDFFRVDVSEYPDFEKCCNKHDICYDTCDGGSASGRGVCDKDFEKCMKKTCTRYKKAGVLRGKEVSQCKSTADMMYAGVVAMGCDPYLESQRDACECKRPSLGGL
ncbi:group XIIA secretory phospholipase A2-like [Sycon ciliatum]|uniref:group XIIA secretory phospholipase A2-like n=1 Tax=Sycon ciliatum TaxID=27933 RepID=UPI0031F65921